MEELQKQIVAMQLIQELIVDVLDDKGIINRGEFEILLKERVDLFNQQLETLNSVLQQNYKNKLNNYFNSKGPAGEA